VGWLLKILMDSLQLYLVSIAEADLGDALRPFGSRLRSSARTIAFRQQSPSGLYWKLRERKSLISVLQGKIQF